MQSVCLWSSFFSSAVLQPCTECSPPMLLPNTCSAAAHQRIHQVCAPNVCPECGATVKQLQFLKHLNETCLHFARRIGYRCNTWLFMYTVLLLHPSCFFFLFIFLFAFLQMFQLSGGVWRAELCEVSHPTGTL